jgi:hypothetical protein
MRSSIPFGVTEGGSDAQQSGNSPAAKSGTIQNGQQETSAPAGEICSTVCTQTLKAGLLIRVGFRVFCGATQQAFLWPLIYFNFASFYKENFCL